MINKIFGRFSRKELGQTQIDIEPVIQPQIPMVVAAPMVAVKKDYAAKKEYNVTSSNIQVVNSPQQEIPVALVTETYTYLGNLATSGKRLQDILNDSLTDYLDLRKVKVASSIDGGTIVQELPSATIIKQQVVLGLLRQDTHEAPSKRQNYRVRRDFIEASVVIHNLRIQGAVHLPRASGKASAILSRDLKNFFALTDATIIDGPNDDNSSETSVVMVNKHAVTLFHVATVG